jgi:hypothetical protein
MGYPLHDILPHSGCTALLLLLLVLLSENLLDLPEDLECVWQVDEPRVLPVSSAPHALLLLAH